MNFCEIRTSSKKDNFSFFFLRLLCSKPYSACKTTLWVFFSKLGTKTINNMEVTLYGNLKQNYWKRVFSVFYVEKRYIGRKPTIMKKKNNITKNMYFSVFLIKLSIKTLKNYAKKSMFCKRKDITRNVYYECF